jgi:nucleoside-diphosphate-sugar epimerase
VLDCDVRERADVDALLAQRPDRLVLLAAQASRPASFRDPRYTEEANLTGTRVVAEAVGAAGGLPVAFGSSLHVYGPASGRVGTDHPYGPQGDLAHLSKVYAELCLRLFAERDGWPLGLLRLGIVFGPSPVEHDGAENVTVVDKFKRLAAAGEPLPMDDGGRATIGVVHVDDAARALLDWQAPGVAAENVVAETVTVADVAALAEGREPPGGATRTFTTSLAYEHDLRGYLR